MTSVITAENLTQKYLFIKQNEEIIAAFDIDGTQIQIDLMKHGFISGVLLEIYISYI